MRAWDTKPSAILFIVEGGMWLKKFVHPPVQASCSWRVLSLHTIHMYNVTSFRLKSGLLAIRGEIRKAAGVGAGGSNPHS